MRAATNGAVLGRIKGAVARGAAKAGSTVITVSDGDGDTLSTELLQILVGAVNVGVGVVAKLGAVRDSEVALEQLGPAVLEAM